MGSGETLAKGYKVALGKKSRDAMHSVMTIVNNTALNTGTLLREYVLGAMDHTQKNGNYVKRRYVN